MKYTGITSREVIGTFYELLNTSMDTAWPFLLGMLFDSNQESETYKWLGMTPALREWIGGRQAKGLREEGVTIINKKFEATLEIDVDSIRRDKTGQINIRIGELVDRVNQHWAKLLTEHIIAGSAATLGLAYDGQFFFDDDHVSGDSGTLTNLLSATEVPNLNVGTAAAPTADEMASAIMDVIAYFFNYKDDQGQPINDAAKEFSVMVPVNLYSPALQALTKNNLNVGTGVRDNPLVGGPFKISLIPNSRLSTTTEFYVFRTDARTSAFILQEEEKVKIQAVAEGSELEFNDDVHRYGVKSLRNVGYGQWQFATHCTLS